MKKDELHRLTIEDIVLGEGFPWDVMDSFGRLLMKQGTSVKNQAHAQDMLDRGMYIEKSLYTKLPPVNKNRRATCRSPIYRAPTKHERSNGKSGFKRGASSVVFHAVWSLYEQMEWHGKSADFCAIVEKKIAR